MKHLEVRKKYSAASRIFNSLLSVSSGDEKLRLMLDILRLKRIKMKTMTENITGACVCSMPIVNLLHNVQFYRFRTSAWTAENASKR